MPQLQILIPLDGSEFAERMLTVMTSHGRGGIIRTALGSVNDALSGSPTPVLVVKSS